MIDIRIGGGSLGAANYARMLRGCIDSAAATAPLPLDHHRVNEE